MEGKAVENAPPALTIYELCKTFGCLPSQLDKENNKAIEELLVIHNAVNAYEHKESRRAKREELKNKVGGGTPRR